MIIPTSVLSILVILAVFAAIIAVIVIAAASKKSPAPAQGEASYFDGNTLQLIGYQILSALVTTLTLGIAYPWMLCTVKRWETKHTVINGRRLKFNGHGHQLIGRYLLWIFLTVITLGIYSIWLGLGMKKWVVKHTVYADEDRPAESSFSGGAGGYLGIHLLAALLTTCTLGIGKAWADTMILRWEARHTHIGGSPLVFGGTGGQLFGKYLLLLLLAPLTLGIYALCFPVILLKWQTKNTDAVYKTPEIQAKARLHENAAVQNFAKYRIAANDQELAALKSGYTGTEDADTLAQLAKDGNPFAAYRLAKQLKGDNTVYEGEALALLQTAADGKVHAALLDMAKQAPADQKISILTEAVQLGNAEASWLLTAEYQNKNDLFQAVYWFKVALEWGVPEAAARSAEYTELIKKIALHLSERQQPKKQNSILWMVLGIVGGVLLLSAVASLIGIRVFKFSSDEITKRPVQEIVYLETVEIQNIQGQTYSQVDQNGYELHYIIDENAFLDQTNQTLYLHFGLSEYENTVYLSDGTGWRTQAINPGDGITAVSYPYANAPSHIEIWAKYDETSGYFICQHPLDVTTGTAVQTEKWLEEKYSSGQTAADPTEAPTSTPTTAPTVAPTQANSESGIVGSWETTDIATSMETGEDTLTIWRWTFNPDGTVFRITYDCQPSTNGQEYYYGRAWTRIGGDRGDGTYTFDGSTLTVTTHDVNGEISHTTVYEAQFADGGLRLSRPDDIPRTYIRTN